ncbi:transcription-repair coupling factor [Alistipes sp.]|uniref:transcription-repair coupling factor n=1 Tax=Alistipes sp. TaxID=1872444 RepID=UPI003AB3ABB7
MNPEVKKTDARELASASKPMGRLLRACREGAQTLHLRELVGGALSFHAATAVRRTGGVHVFVAEDRDAAAYLLNDFYALLDESRILFFPSSYKRSIVYGTEDAQGVVQRTATLNALTGFAGKEAKPRRGEEPPYLVVCTYPEALAERVADRESLARETIRIGVGERISIPVLVQSLADAGFVQVDFVYEPGQYSVRGGIVDVFSFAESKPFRLDFFGDDVDSIRRFEISSQLSSERLERAEIIPDLRQREQARVTFARFAGEGVAYWFPDADYALRRVNDLRKRVLAETDEPQAIDLRLASRRTLLEDMAQSRLMLLRDSLRERPADAVVDFDTAPQPRFNKNFELLADDILASAQRGYTTYILSENKAQIERLQNIFRQVGRGQVHFETLPLTLHEGFVDNDLRCCLYTDHQIFDRYQRYRINGEIKRDEQMTVAELNQLRMGDYVVHIDHGIGRFGGLVKINENGRVHEAIKLVYRDNDVLFVNVHALHRIARYKSGDGEPPKIYKLGSGAWLKLKNAAKKAVKDISRELIALYARRKASRGFAFSPDSYLQHELEASFMWEDTPDQQAATAAVKRDMESDQPMDRLVCGDVGFGKTEVAVRAAFKAATDGKQVAVLVPTTILALQHYRSFSERLREFPVRVEYLNRTKSSRDTAQIAADLEAGKIDILIGTHKMLGKGIRFRDLGLLIIDEEQKFGVAAKEKLTQMSVSVDTLTLTATPIPRTLQFSLMGSRDLSVISTAPPNRQPIQTESHVFSEEIVRDAVRAELARGGQVYFVHNRVEELQSLQGMLARLCPEARVGVGHGKMPAEQLEKLIMDFIYGEFDVLLSTTIIENGIDIPNANTIIVNDAHRFGLSDLHQLRGRVGRSDVKAYCYLLTPPDELLGSDARRRLRAIEEFSDLGSGFNIAMQDLDIRGAGNLLGAQQSGFIADVGFETYQKIMQQAVAELRAEGLDVAGLTSREQEVVGQMNYIEDATIEIDALAELPDDYVRQPAEKLRLYRELDSTRDEEALVRFEARLADRFGALPGPARELLNVVRLRWEAVRLGMERVKVRNGLMIVHFVGDESSPYYKSETFMQLLQRVTADPSRFVLKQHNNRLAMTVRQIKDIEEAYRVLRSL